MEIEVFGLVETQIQTLGTKPIISRNKTTAAAALAWAMQSKQVDDDNDSVSSKENRFIIMALIFERLQTLKVQKSPSSNKYGTSLYQICDRFWHMAARTFPNLMRSQEL